MGIGKKMYEVLGGESLLAEEERERHLLEL
jgi:hypothetical protein